MNCAEILIFVDSTVNGADRSFDHTALIRSKNVSLKYEMLLILFLMYSSVGKILYDTLHKISTSYVLQSIWAKSFQIVCWIIPFNTIKRWLLIPITWTVSISASALFITRQISGTKICSGHIINKLDMYHSASDLSSIIHSYCNSDSLNKKLCWHFIFCLFCHSFCYLFQKG